jgi:hypothetical protein
MKPTLLDPLDGPNWEWELAKAKGYDSVAVKFLYFAC